MCRALQITGVPILWWGILCGPVHHTPAVAQQGWTYGTHFTWNSQQIHCNQHARSWCSSITHSGPVGTLGRSSEEVRALIDSLRSVAGFHSAFCEQLQLICIAHLISHTQSLASYLPDLHCIQRILQLNQAKFVLMSYDDNINVYSAELDLKPSCPSFICSLHQ